MADKVKDKAAEPKTKAAKTPATSAKDKAPKAAKEATSKAPKATPSETKVKAEAVNDSDRFRLKKLYIEKAVPGMMKKFNYKNINEVPRIEKVILNMGLGDCKDNSKSYQLAVEELRIISGQKPVITAAKKSVANFKIRKGMNVGAKVTLRGARMYDFLDKFINIVLPRVRDFRGVSNKSFDGRGNYALGVKEQLIFPEISYDKIEKVRGLDVVIVTSANTDEEARELLAQIGMPFAR